MFSQEDLARYRAFKVVMNQAKFDIQGNAVIAAASLFAWFGELEKKIEGSIEAPPLVGKLVESPFSDLGLDLEPKQKQRKSKGRMNAD